MFTPLSEILREIDPDFNENLHDLQISHVMKSWPEYFNVTRRGAKTFDLRKRKEGRVFMPSQYIIFREWDPRNQAYTGRWDLYFVKWILQSEACLKFGFNAYKEGLGGDILSLLHVTGN